MKEREKFAPHCSVMVNKLNFVILGSSKESLVNNNNCDGRDGGCNNIKYYFIVASSVCNL